MHKSFIILPVIAILFFTTSCLTGPENTITPTEAPVITVIDGITISLRYMHEDELLREYGKVGNVFTEYPARIQRKKTVVYQLDIESNKTEAIIDLRNITLKIGEVSAQSKYPGQLIDVWSTYLQSKEEQENAKRLTSRNMYKNKIAVSPASPASGLIVFLAKYPAEGDSYITIGIEDNSGNLREIEISLNPETIDTLETK